MPAEAAATVGADEGATEHASTPTLPDLPSRVAVRSALDGAIASMRACAADDSRTAFVTITFAGSGRATTAITDAPYAGSAAGSCMARAARGITIAPFSRATFTVHAPFAMH